MSRGTVPKVPGRSKRSIEDHAYRLLRRYYPDCLVTPQPTPVADFVEFALTQDFEVDVKYRLLPAPTEAVMTPGNAATGSRTTIYFLPQVYGDLVDNVPRARFTGAHEAYHAIVHAKEIEQSLSDGPIYGLYRKADLRPFEDPEWQANAFAAAFLQPEAMVRQLAARTTGNLLFAMQAVFDVSAQAAGYRLKGLGLL